MVHATYIVSVGPQREIDLALVGQQHPSSAAQNLFFDEIAVDGASFFLPQVFTVCDSKMSRLQDGVRSMSFPSLFLSISQRSCTIPV